MRQIRDSPAWPVVRSLLGERPYKPGVPEIRHWSDVEDAYLRMPDEDWEELRNTPGMTGDDDFDRAMLALHRLDDGRAPYPEDELVDD